MNNCVTQPNIQTVFIPLQGATVKPYIKQGDTIPAWIPSAPDWGFDFTDVNANVEITMNLFSGRNLVKTFTLGDGFSIVNAISFQVDEMLTNNFPEGKLIGDLKIAWTEGGNRYRFTFFNVIYTILKEF